MSTESTPSEPHGPRRRAVVTGASAGIGLAFAERLAREDYDLVLVARQRERLEAIAKRLHESRGVTSEVVAADLSRPDELRSVEERVARDATLDLLVNNAAFGTVGPFAELDLDREEEQIRLNVIALVRLTRAALPGMIARGHGEIVNVSSLSALQPDPYNATYGATKAYVNSFTEALHEELRGTGVKVQVLCPGFTRTEFQKRAGMDTSFVPGFAWMSAEAVVDASMAALKRGDLICVPGTGNRVVATVSALLPRALVRRMAGTAARRFSG